MSLPLCQMWLKATSGFRKCRGGEISERTDNICSMIGCKNSCPQKTTTQTHWLCAHNFPQGEDAGEETPHRVNDHVDSWATGRFHVSSWRRQGECVLNFGLVSMILVISPKLTWMQAHTFKKWTRYNSCTWHLSETFYSLLELLMGRWLRPEILLIGDWQIQKGKWLLLPSVRQHEQEMDKAWILIKPVRKDLGTLQENCI